MSVFIVLSLQWTIQSKMLSRQLYYIYKSLRKMDGNIDLSDIKVLGNWSCELIRSLSKNEECEKQRWEDRTMGNSNIKHFLKLESLLWHSESTNRITRWKNKHLLMLGLVAFSCICMWVLWQQWVGYALFPLHPGPNQMAVLSSLESNLCYHIEIFFFLFFF